MKKEIKDISIRGKKFKAELMIIEKNDRKMLKKIFEDWKKANLSVKRISTRGINLPEALSESIFCLFFPSARVIKVFGKTSGSFDTIDLKTNRRQQIKASSIAEDLTSFGPKSVWDDLYFLNFLRMDGSFDVYKIPNKFIYEQGVNKMQTFKQQQAQKRRPRFSITNKIIRPKNIKPIKTCKL